MKYLLIDMNFIFFCSTRYLTCSLRSLVRYWVGQSKIKVISTRRHVISSISYTMSTWSPAFVGWPTWSADLVGILENNDILFSLHFFTNIHILHNLFYPYFARVTLAGMESNRIPVNQNVLPVSCVISFFAGAPYNPGPPMGGGWGRYNLISFMYLC